MQQLEESGSVSGSTLNIATGKSSSNMENSRVILGAVLILAACSIVAVVLAAVALNNNNDTPNINVGSMPSGSSSGSAAQAPIVISSGGAGGAGGAGGPTNAAGKRIFTIAYGHDWGAHNYLDEEGYIAGFSKELIAAVCEAAGVDCRTVWDKWTNCWDSTAGEHSMGGRGLFDRWYDGCMGWVKSVNRMQTFAFGTAYLKNLPASFYVKKGNNFNPKDITGKKIAFLDGWISDEKCIARQTDITGRIMPVDKIVHILQVKDAIDSVQNGTVDAVTGTDTVFKPYLENGQLEKKGSFFCYISGSTVMTRKDNDLLSYWNQGFAKIQSSGKFKQLCAEATEKHGSEGPIFCV